MPKLKNDIWADKVRREIKSQMERTGTSRQVVEIVIDCKTPTYYERLKHPEKFQLGELKRLTDRLHFTDEQILLLFGR